MKKLLVLLPIVLLSCDFFGRPDKIPPENPGPLVTIYTENPEAYNSIPKGRAHFYEDSRLIDLQITQDPSYLVFTNVSTGSVVLPTFQVSGGGRNAGNLGPQPAFLQGPSPQVPSSYQVYSTLFNEQFPLERGSAGPVPRFSRSLSANINLATVKDLKIKADKSRDGKSTVKVKLLGKSENISTAIGRWSVYIWVDTSDPYITATSTIPGEFASRFLKTGGDNDIFDWITAIFEAPWGSHGYSELIRDGEKSIHIIVTDIDGDGGNSGASTGGYYYSLHNLTNQEGSNKQLQFVMDSKEASTNINGALSTLAHEFQHMINYYQGTVEKGTVTPVWLNELMSEMASDFIADKIPVPGPRATPLSGSGGYQYQATPSKNPNSGYSGSLSGRIEFSSHGLRLGYSHRTWRDGDSVLYSYGLNYSLGNYLAKNFGGVQFYSDLMKNMSPDGVLALEKTLRDAYPKESYASILRKWPVAMLLSAGDAPATLQYTKMTPPYSFVSSIGGVGYQLGSINHHSYEVAPISDIGTDQPKFQGEDVYTKRVPSKIESGGSFIYQLTQKNAKFSVSMPSGLRLAVVTPVVTP